MLYRSTFLAREIFYLLSCFFVVHLLYKLSPHYFSKISTFFFYLFCHDPGTSYHHFSPELLQQPPNSSSHSSVSFQFIFHIVTKLVHSKYKYKLNTLSQNMPQFSPAHRRIKLLTWPINMKLLTFLTTAWTILSHLLFLSNTSLLLVPQKHHNLFLLQSSFGHVHPSI